MFGKNIFNKLENSFKAQNTTWIHKNLRVYIEPINLFDKYNNELYYEIAVESINMWANAISEFIDIPFFRASGIRILETSFIALDIQKRLFTIFIAFASILDISNISLIIPNRCVPDTLISLI